MLPRACGPFAHTTQCSDPHCVIVLALSSVLLPTVEVGAKAKEAKLPCESQRYERAMLKMTSDLVGSVFLRLPWVLKESQINHRILGF